MQISIQYISDIHLDIKASKFRKILKPSADILILSGDIGHPFRKTYYQFLKWCNSKYMHVFLIPGNREYYGSSLLKCKKKLKQLSKKTGVIILDRDVYELPEYDLVILGATLWSSVSHEDTFNVLMKNKDYSCIEGFDIGVSNSLHLEDKQWLKKTINFYNTKNPEYKVIVATHHPPVYNHTISPYSRDYYSHINADNENIMRGVDIWIYGHTHYNSTHPYILDGGEQVIVTSNQRGFPGEMIGYGKDGFLTIDGDVSSSDSE